MPAEHARVYLEEAPDAAQGRLAAAAAGAVIGPVLDDGRYTTWVVRSRSRPDPQEPDIRAKAAAQVMADALRKRRAGKVRWHERH